MCRYNYSNGRCANIDIDAYFCIGERNCSISEFLKSEDFEGNSMENFWRPLPSKIWSIGKRTDEK